MAGESSNIIPVEVNIMIEALEAEGEDCANWFRAIVRFTSMRVRGRQV
jgi:hypothetical protein